MSGQLLVFSESIDDVLKVVQETPRGRWFIEGYTQKLKNEGTGNILAAIAKLENHIGSMSNSGASEAILQKARHAIATARQEIANLEPKSATLSGEAKLFANLAEMSRQAFDENPSAPSLSKGVERALKLVADLDRDLNETPSASAAPTKPAQQYFKQDEAIFEAAPAPKLVTEPAPVSKTVEVPEVTNRGAKLVIRRLSQTETPAEEIKIEETAFEVKIEPSIEEPVTTISSSEPASENSRIIIIRRKADEVTAVPLVDAEMAIHAA